MKKIISAITLGVAIMTLASCSDEQKKTVARTAFLSKCAEGLANMDATIAKEYCECSTDIIFEKFTVDEIAEFGKQSQNSVAKMEEMQKLIAPCLAELSKKATEAQGATNPAK